MTSTNQNRCRRSSWPCTHDETVTLRRAVQYKILNEEEPKKSRDQIARRKTDYFKRAVTCLALTTTPSNPSDEAQTAAPGPELLRMNEILPECCACERCAVGENSGRIRRWSMVDGCVEIKPRSTLRGVMQQYMNSSHAKNTHFLQRKAQMYGIARESPTPIDMHFLMD